MSLKCVEDGSKLGIRVGCLKRGVRESTCLVDIHITVDLKNSTYCTKVIDRITAVL